MQHPLKIPSPGGVGKQVIVTHSSTFIGQYIFRNVWGKGEVQEVSSLCRKCLGGVLDKKILLPQSSAIARGFFQWGWILRAGVSHWARPLRGTGGYFLCCRTLNCWRLGDWVLFIFMLSTHRLVSAACSCVVMWTCGKERNLPEIDP